MSTVANQSLNQRQIAPLSKLWWVGIVAGVVSAVGNLIFFFITSVAGISYMIPVQNPEVLEPLPAMVVAIASFMPAIGATILFALLGRFLSQGVRIFTIISVLFLIVSFAMPFTLPAAVPMATKIALNVMHVISGVAIIGVLLKLGK